jgi:hypothetical protein
MSLVRRRLVGILVLLVAANLAATTAAQCAGWQNTPIARAACCKAHGHHCPHRQQTQRAADQCCAQGEQSRQSTTIIVAASAVVVRPAVLTTAILDLLAVGLQSAQAASVARSFEAHTLTIPHESPYLVFSVFRI